MFWTTDKSRAFDRPPLSRHLGQRYWSGLHQLAAYLDDYHHDLDHRLGTEQTGTEMICAPGAPRTER